MCTVESSLQPKLNSSFSWQKIKSEQQMAAGSKQGVKLSEVKGRAAFSQSQSAPPQLLPWMSQWCWGIRVWMAGKCAASSPSRSLHGHPQCSCPGSSCFTSSHFILSKHWRFYVHTFTSTKNQAHYILGNRPHVLQCLSDTSRHYESHAGMFQHCLFTAKVSKTGILS